MAESEWGELGNVTVNLLAKFKVKGVKGKSEVGKLKVGSRKSEVGKLEVGRSGVGKSVPKAEDGAGCRLETEHQRLWSLGHGF